MVTGEPNIDVLYLEGRVTRVSRNGFQLDTHPDEWFNKSNFGSVQFLPQAGQYIEVECTRAAKGGYWVDSWAAPQNASQSPQESSQGPSEWLQDDRAVVTRLACLNAAVRTVNLQSGAGVAVEEVILGLAERYVAWATWGGGAQFQPEEQIDPDNLNLDQDSDVYYEPIEQTEAPPAPAGSTPSNRTDSRSGPSNGISRTTGPASEPATPSRSRPSGLASPR